MFRKPRDDTTPAVGRPPSPTHGASLSTPLNTTTALPITSSMSSKIATTAQTPKKQIAPTNHISSKPRSAISSGKNSSILNFFKKSSPGGSNQTNSPSSLFVHDQSPQKAQTNGHAESSEILVDDEFELYSTTDYIDGHNSLEELSRFNEQTSSNKRRRLSPTLEEKVDIEAQYRDDAKGAGYKACSPPPPDIDKEPNAVETSHDHVPTHRPGPFLDDSDTDVEDEQAFISTIPKVPVPEIENDAHAVVPSDSLDKETTGDEAELSIPSLKREATSFPEEELGFEDFEGLEDFEDEYPEGEEFLERRWQMEQRRLELEEQGFRDDMDDDDTLRDFDINGDPEIQDTEQTLEEDPIHDISAAPTCPICSASLAGIADQDVSVHVNNCLDGNPTPIPVAKNAVKEEPDDIDDSKSTTQTSRRPFRPAKPGQSNPFTLGVATGTSSAFSKLMSGHAEDTAWATAAASEHASRGKPSYQRTCPFYKILPGFNICVDAFRYGAVKGCNAYFLSHFHSDHYVGLTATWSHGPIYCSRPTGNLVRQQLRVDPRYVVDLEFDRKFEVPGTNGVYVTMIPANHCPGSSLYLFEKTIGTGKNPRVQRVLHCGDFRACPAHVEHPLLKPDVVDLLTGKTQHQKIDVCYLDTTYLNPRYAFPSQEDVIQACADMCTSLSREKINPSDDWEQMKRDRAGTSMAKFIRKDSTDISTDQTAQTQADLPTESVPPTKSEDSVLPDTHKTAPPSVPSNQNQNSRGRLLVVVGTYSIGKERICLGIARALNSKIYAPPGKQRICACLEDPELYRLLTRNPREAQVHMTPLFEIRAETLTEYLADYRDTFSRAVAFRPSGWNYKPPGSRFTESPAVSTVLFSENWKSTYSVRDLVPQRGSNSRAATYGVPYSEHSSFRELTMFCCALRIDKVIPTVNVGSAKSRERMKLWVDRWNTYKKKEGLFRLPARDDDEAGNESRASEVARPPRAAWYPAKGTWQLRTNL